MKKLRLPGFNGREIQYSPRGLLDDILRSTHFRDQLVIAIDGNSGSGKSTLAEGLAASLKKKGVPHQRFSSDLTRISYQQAPTVSGVDRRRFDLLAQLASPYTDISFEGYDSVTHRVDLPIHKAPLKEGVLIIEGLWSVAALGCLPATVSSVGIYLDVPDEVALSNRTERNLNTGRWEAPLASEIIRRQTPFLNAYARDLRRYFL